MPDETGRPAMPDETRQLDLLEARAWELAAHAWFEDTAELAANILAALRTVQQETARATWERAARVVEGERLEDPQSGTSDEAYDRAVRDCADAIRAATPTEDQQ